MKLISPSFTHNAMIPSTFTCDGEDISPPLNWADAPQATQSFALIVDDPDAPIGTWVHWVLFNIPAGRSHLEEKLGNEKNLPEGMNHGRNSWQRRDYGGPCPPSGTHRYFFKLYALDTVLDLEQGVSKKKLVGAMQGHILDSCELVGLYKRSV